MTKSVWDLPFPSSGASGVSLLLKPKREILLRIDGEDRNGDLLSIELLFAGVQAYECIYLGLLTKDMIETAYDKLVDLGETSRMKKANQILQARRSPGSSHTSKSVRHFRICLDDGPCYEFICEDVLVQGISV